MKCKICSGIGTIPSTKYHSVRCGVTRRIHIRDNNDICICSDTTLAGKVLHALNAQESPTTCTHCAGNGVEPRRFSAYGGGRVRDSHSCAADNIIALCHRLGDTKFVADALEFYHRNNYPEVD